MNIKKELERYNLSEEKYEQLLKDCCDKKNRVNDMDWSEINSIYGLSESPDTLRKACATILGGPFVKQYMEEKNLKDSSESKVLDEIRKERIKLQTLNLERNRIDRAESRRELFYEYVGSAITALPSPNFTPLFTENDHDANETSYVLTLADIHYNAEFQSERNVYSPVIVRDRFEYLAEEIKKFVERKRISLLSIVNLGDTIQGCLRLSDIKLNESSVVQSVVEVSQLLSSFLVTLSSFVSIAYYHVPKANHSQIRFLNSKANMLQEEDLEYIIGHYIEALCKDNERIGIYLPKDGAKYIRIYVPGFDVYARHGHDIRNVENAIRDMESLTDENVDYLLLGHYHAHDVVISSEKVTYDSEILVSPSFMGSDPYSDTLFRSSKGAVKILGFDEIYGHTETYKIILN